MELHEVLAARAVVIGEAMPLETASSNPFDPFPSSVCRRSETGTSCGTSETVAFIKGEEGEIVHI